MSISVFRLKAKSPKGGVLGADPAVLVAMSPGITGRAPGVMAVAEVAANDAEELKFWFIIL